MNTSQKRIDYVSTKLVREGSGLYKTRKISNPKASYEIFRELLENEDREKMVLMCLNTKNEPTHISIISIGSLNSSIVHPREVFKVAILSNASSIIIAHNHPSGDVTPSREDISITKRLQESGEVLGIELLDHIIVGENKFKSLKECGMM